MSGENNSFDIGEVEYTPEQLAGRRDTGLGDDSFADFTVAEHMGARELDRYSVRSVVMAFYLKLNGKSTSDVDRDESKWSCAEFFAFATAVSSLGSSNAVKGDIGKVDWNDVESMLNVPLNVLKARVVVEKKVVTRDFTDRTLGLYVCSTRGAVIETKQGDSVVMFPGCPVNVTIGGSGFAAGRITSNGKEFIDWHNKTYKSNYTYTAISPDAIRLSFFVMTYHKMEIKEGVMRLAPLARQGPMTQHRVEVAEPARTSMMGGVKTMIAKVMTNFSSRPVIGHNSDPVAYFELVAHRGLVSESPGSLAHVAKFLTILDANGKMLRNRLEALYPSIVPAEVTHVNVAKFISTPPVVNGVRLDCHAAVASFVEASRTQARGGVDLMDKSDATGFGSAAQSVTNVPHKISAAIEALHSLIGPIRHPVEAFGTGKYNHWHNTVEDAAKSGVVFHDNVSTMVPPLGGMFEAMNVESLAKGFGAGKVIFDDTWNGQDNAPGKANFLGKCQCVAAAGFEGGFLKLAMGAGSDGPTTFSQIPETVKVFMADYNVILSPGSSPHSPEYFLVFAKKEHTKGFVVPSRLVEGYGLKGTGKSTADQYVKGWLATRAVEIVKANLLLNAQILTGNYTGVKESWPTWSLREPAKARLSGHTFPALTLPANHLVNEAPSIDEVLGVEEVVSLGDLQADGQSSAEKAGAAGDKGKGVGKDRERPPLFDNLI